MSYYYLDASALVKNYVIEPGTTWIRELIGAVDSQGGPIHTIFIADASVAETTAALAVLYRSGRIRRPAWEGAFDEFMDDITWRYQLVGTHRDDFFAAAAMTRIHPLKAYDAVQLAVALRHNRALAEYELHATFVSGDRPLVQAAQAEGLPTDNPFEHIVAQDTSRPHT